MNLKRQLPLRSLQEALWRWRQCQTTRLCLTDCLPLSPKWCMITLHSTLMKALMCVSPCQPNTYTSRLEWHEDLNSLAWPTTTSKHSKYTNQSRSASYKRVQGEIRHHSHPSKETLKATWRAEILTETCSFSRLIISKRWLALNLAMMQAETPIRKFRILTRKVISAR